MARMTREQLLEMVVAVSKLRTSDLTFVFKSAHDELTRRKAKAEEKKQRVTPDETDAVVRKMGLRGPSGEKVTHGT